MINILISANISKINKNSHIEDSIKSFIRTCLAKNARLVFGGHPTITPLISKTLRELPFEFNRQVTLYQSRYFDMDFISENSEFINLKLIDVIEDVKDEKNASLTEMRKRMINDSDFDAAIFIGKTKGIKDEYRMLKKRHPRSSVFFNELNYSTLC